MDIDTMREVFPSIVGVVEFYVGVEMGPSRK